MDEGTEIERRRRRRERGGQRGRAEGEGRGGMPSMESSFMARRKHEDICGHGVPALNIVGVACVKYFCDMSSYVSMAASTCGGFA